MSVIFALVVLGLVPAYISYRKGRNFFTWWLAGALLWIVVTPVAIYLRSKNEAGQPRRIGKSFGLTVAGTSAALLISGVVIALTQPAARSGAIASKLQIAPTLVATIEPKVLRVAQEAAHPAPPPAAPTPVASAPKMPPDEVAFVAVIQRYATAYGDGANDFAKGATRPARAHALCSLFHRSFRVKDWLGTVQDLSSSSDGHGVLVLQVADQVTLGTTNNDISDSLGMHTLIKPDSPIFAKAAALQKDQSVSFSGRFATKDDDCLEEDSLTQEGSMTEPQFLFQFSDLAAQ